MDVIEGRAFIKGDLVPCCIGVEDGRIAAIKKAIRGEEHHDYGDLIILPGAIDPHVHMREPGLTHKEDFNTGTMAAVFGGVTCILDMPNTVPPTTDRERLYEKRQTASRRCWTDFGLLGGAADPREMIRMAPEVPGYKLFMSSTTGELAYKGDPAPVIRAAVSQGRVLSVHAEDEGLFGRRAEWSLSDHLDNRPPEAEASAIRKLGELTDYDRLNICHLSSARGLEEARPLPFAREVTPHHLLLSANGDLGTWGKVNPPLRREEDREAMFQAFRSGEIQMLASDHAPHTKGEKEEEFPHAPSGVPGVETSFPLMMNMVKRGMIDLPRLVACASAWAAHLLGLNKGLIEVGRDADLMVIDPRQVTTIRGEELHHKCGWTPFEGWEAIFPHATFLRGQRVMEDGALTSGRMGRDITADGG
ncbi:MAG: dihydroorotase [Methanomassiliicoccales archaeon]